MLVMGVKKYTPQQDVEGLVLSGSPGQNDFRKFCLSDEIKKIHRELEEAISV